MAYQVTFETADGIVEHHSDFANKCEAFAAAKSGAKSQTFNEAMEVTRYFVETAETTIATFAVQ